MQKRSLSPQLTVQWHIEKAEIKNVFNTFAALLKCWLQTATKLLSPFLVDCTNGRAYATVLRLSSSVCLYEMYCG